MIYIQLFLSFLQVGALSFGGGYAAMPLIQEQVVNLHSWLSMSEFTNLITIAEMTPGPIAVNGAIVVGYKLAGLTGTLVAIIGTIIPPFVIISLISAFYHAFRDNYLVSLILYYCNLVGICLYEVSEYVLTSGNTGISQTGSCIDDRQSRGNDFNFCIFH